MTGAREAPLRGCSDARRFDVLPAADSDVPRRNPGGQGA
jgi:hypothetical protein